MVWEFFKHQRRVGAGVVESTADEASAQAR
jgi:hypothetical protein